MVEFTDEEAKQLLDAFKASGVFFTPIMRMRLKDTWGEYHADAQQRRHDAMELLASKGLI